MRTLAVLIVISDHYAPFRNFAGGAPARLGGFGVDLFFVLSGFLITTILLGLRNTDRPYQVFYIRRFLRILPPYLLLLVFVYGTGALLHEPLEKSKLAGQLLFLRSFKETGPVLSHLFAVLRGAAPVPGLFHQLIPTVEPRDYPWLPMSGSLGPTWSLSVEEWFYVLWAPVVLLFRRTSILGIGILVCVTGFLMRWLGGGGAEFFSSVDILIAGAILALWIEHRKTLPGNTRERIDSLISWVSIAAFLLFIGLTWLHRDLTARTLIEIFVFGFVAWLIHHAGHANPVCSLLRWKPLVYVGTISYMVYLMHLPLYFLVRSALTPVLAGWSEVPRMWVIALCSIAATLLFSALSWKFYESPVLSFKDVLTDRILEGTGTPSHGRAAAAAAASGPVSVALMVDEQQLPGAGL